MPQNRNCLFWGFGSLCGEESNSVKWKIRKRWTTFAFRPTSPLNLNPRNLKRGSRPMGEQRNNIRIQEDSARALVWKLFPTFGLLRSKMSRQELSGKPIHVSMYVGGWKIRKRRIIGVHGLFTDMPC